MIVEGVKLGHEDMILKSRRRMRALPRAHRRRAAALRTTGRTAFRSIMMCIAAAAGRNRISSRAEML